ncbi:ccmB family protein [Ehrlichia chaffeensis str. Heartland]|uniref:Heme exporter protein B n=1 Tax=Ehrlichia chaffeensis (strain ATCC CRL-10679 / Arkansas) TaxID=205920 RepID=Q2GI37_EHRCR|nr:heme exporter protein CcmB [Ehrlichia chaffeensis]ABD44861.1 putative heme exporter protein CcmB [Ehrlichia chaffeensis str. Arkansas]AHX04118.1 ccmB family protein [Ehrlichia chaffeensis str. Heartland]AHX06054.1 ccmB family protein [Ehrlichia chaffeensis str. Jax]AHX07875.1 ccmB family protein [Ehrlichia chaffeensis str. Osceola]AHX08498.1 ccmB family protein [Ehrlichia chaffeensis str. Saint Vincent]
MGNSSALMYELKLSMSRKGNLLNAIILFILIISTALFTMKNVEIIKVLPTILWICSISAVHMSMCHLFENDYANGSLEQMLIQESMVELIIFFKILSHWICVGIPVSIISMFIDFIILESNIYTTLGLGLSLGISLLVISFISAVGEALVLGRGSGIIIAQILTLPIMIPVLVYFSLVFDSIINGVYRENLMLLGLIIAGVVPISVIFVSFAIRVAVEYD